MEEIYRLTPVVGKIYETAEYTKREGKYPKERYFTDKPLIMAGKFIKHVKTGYGDYAKHYDIFDLNGKEKIVNYTYEGTTCFKEVIETPSKKG